MMRLAGISAFFILAAGCGVGDDGGTNPNPNPNGRVCGAVLATSFHPEVTGDHRVHRLFVDMVSATV